MILNCGQNAGERRERRENVHADPHVLLHPRVFVLGERARFVQQRLGNSDLADVMQLAGQAEIFYAALTHKRLSSKAQVLGEWVAPRSESQYIPQLPEWRACLRTVSTPFVQSKTHLLIF